jgi:hypothetical protein
MVVVSVILWAIPYVVLAIIHKRLEDKNDKNK